MEYDLNSLKHQQDELLSRLNSLSMEQPKQQVTDAYSEIEIASSKLSDTDKQDLLKDETYCRLVAELNAYIQQEQFRLIRNTLNSNSSAVKLMNRIADYITQFKQDTDNKKANTLKQFEEYINNYSDMTYSDYLKTISNK